MPRFSALAALAVLAILPLSSLAAAEAPQRTVVLTFDDLPLAPRADDLATARRVTDALLRVLAEHKAPAAGFVNEDKVHRPGEVDERIASDGAVVREPGSLADPARVPLHDPRTRHTGTAQPRHPLDADVPARLPRRADRHGRA